MILTREKIIEAINSHDIEIIPFDEKFVQPNNYDFHLENYLLKVHRLKGTKSEIEKIKIPEKGYLLKPNTLYLGNTLEKVSSDSYSQLLFGDKTIGNLGIWVHISAPLGHTGSSIKWTLEIKCIREVRIYPYMRFGKICFIKNIGKKLNYSENTFNKPKYISSEITTSLIDLD